MKGKQSKKPPEYPEPDPETGGSLGPYCLCGISECEPAAWNLFSGRHLFL